MSKGSTKKLKILAAWLGSTDIRAARGEIDGVGPIAAALGHDEYDEAHILVADDTRNDKNLGIFEERGKYADWAAKLSPARIVLHETRVTDPTDMMAVHAAADGVIGPLEKRASSITFQIASGTPFMTAAWILLSGRYGARLVHSGTDGKVTQKKGIFDFVRDTVGSFGKRSLERPEIVAEGPEMKEVLDSAYRFAGTDHPVLIQGATGTGKELIANYIHSNSSRAQRAFRPVNCGAIPSNLIESTFFGHVKGAFTGATSDRPGVFEDAKGGTVFLDEVGEMPPDVQVRLLRVLQEKRVMRLGDTKEKKVDFRLVCATNRDLAQMVKEGKFREDLFYRIAIAVIRLPDLAARGRADIDAHVDRVLDRIEVETGTRPGIDEEAMEFIRSFHWPGNIRELEAVLTRASVDAERRDGRIGRKEITSNIIPVVADTDLLGRPLPLGGGGIEELHLELDRHYLGRAFAEAGRSKVEAARLVGLSPKTFGNRLNRAWLGDPPAEEDRGGGR